MRNGRRKTVVIDCFPEAAEKYGGDVAVVAIDVIRATTTVVTAFNEGRRCFPVPTTDAAWSLAGELRNPLLAGELGGTMPEGFDINNSPAEIAARTDVERPLILLSSSGTRLIDMAADAGALYAACFRNFRAVARHVAMNHTAVALIGAGSLDEFREEDQMCCAWIAELLLDSGFEARDRMTLNIVDAWAGRAVEACLVSKSVKYLERTDQRDDLYFILSHIDDVTLPAAVADGEVFPYPQPLEERHIVPERKEYVFR
jgi:2-phosphosulfolactate phosphatase